MLSDNDQPLPAPAEKAHEPAPPDPADKARAEAAAAAEAEGLQKLLDARKKVYADAEVGAGPVVESEDAGLAQLLKARDGVYAEARAVQDADDAAAGGVPVATPSGEDPGLATLLRLRDLAYSGRVDADARRAANPDDITQLYTTRQVPDATQEG